MDLLAVIDATNSRAPEGPATVVAGLSLLERTLRLAAVCGADEIIIYAADPPALPPVDANRLDADVRFARPDESLRPRKPPEITLYLDASTVFDRAHIQRIVADFEATAPGTALRSAQGELALEHHTLTPPLHATHHQTLNQRLRFDPALSLGWSIAIDSREATQRAERRLLNSCRKREDGVISRHLNRHISLAISRRLAATAIAPDHVTAVTFLLGVAAALAAGFGHYSGFLMAGILYQLNSILDGVDGELARLRYEFSLRGEWLDTISDDLADLFIYLGIGFGAWRTLPDAPGPFDTTFWLILAIVAASGKLATMAIYYSWLAKCGRGDLLSFQWSFEEKPKAEATSFDRLLEGMRYLFRKDFIVYVAMITSIGGALPYLLIVLAPGNVVVAVSVLLQHPRHRAPS